MQKIEIDMNLVPKTNMDRFLRRMANEIIRIKHEEPENWAKICARTEEIRKEREQKGG